MKNDCAKVTEAVKTVKNDEQRSLVIALIIVVVILIV